MEKLHRRPPGGAAQRRPLRHAEGLRLPRRRPRLPRRRHLRSCCPASGATRYELSPQGLVPCRDGRDRRSVRDHRPHRTAVHPARSLAVGPAGLRPPTAVGVGPGRAPSGRVAGHDPVRVRLGRGGSRRLGVVPGEGQTPDRRRRTRLAALRSGAERASPFRDRTGRRPRRCSAPRRSRAGCPRGT